MRLILFSMFVLLAGNLQAVTICSDSATVTRAPQDQSALFITYQNNVTVTLADGTIAHADIAFIDTRTNRCTLRGNVAVLQTGGKSLSGEVVFDLQTKQLTSTGTQEKPVETKLHLAQLWGKK